jgi:hypothetical protein
MQITIDEYAKRFKMSKEMIRAKLRAGRLPHETVDGMTYITVKAPAPQPPREERVQRTTAGAIISMYQQENAQLKKKINELETKIDRLIGDKEQMLREERDRIETIYASRDEQLKSFLELVNAKLVQDGQKRASVPQDAGMLRETGTFPAAAADPEPVVLPEQMELMHYLDAKQYTPSEKKSIKRRFAKAYGNDIRVIQQNGEFILDFSKYDYSDLLAR